MVSNIHVLDTFLRRIWTICVHPSNMNAVNHIQSFLSRNCSNKLSWLIIIGSISIGVAILLSLNVIRKYRSGLLASYPSLNDSRHSNDWTEALRKPPSSVYTTGSLHSAYMPGYMPMLTAPPEPKQDPPTMAIFIVTSAQVLRGTPTYTISLQLSQEDIQKLLEYIHLHPNSSLSDNVTQFSNKGHKLHDETMDNAPMNYVQLAEPIAQLFDDSEHGTDGEKQEAAKNNKAFLLAQDASFIPYGLT